MAATIADIIAASSIKKEWKLNASPKVITVTEEGTFTGLAGLDLAGGDVIKILLKITDPSGAVIHEGTTGSPTFTIQNAGSTLTQDINIPNDADGNPLEGDYVFEYTIEYTDADGPNLDGTMDTETICFKDSTPTGDLGVTADCVQSKLTSTDNTTYPAGTTVTRSLTIKAPLKADGTRVVADVSTSNKSKIVTGIYTGSYDVLMDNDVSIPLGNNGYVVNDVTDVVNYDVNCDLDLCDIFCCIDKLTKEVAAAKYRNPKAWNERFYEWQQVINYYVLYRQAIECGQNTRATAHYNSILELAQCEPGCGCDDNTPTLIVAVGSAANLDIDVRDGSGINIAVTTEGDTTVYTVSLTDAILADIASISRTSVAIGSANYFTVAEADGVYTITWAGPDLDYIDVEFSVNLSAAYDVTFSKDQQSIFGSRYEYEGDLDTQKPKIGFAGTPPSGATNTANAAMIYEISEYLATPDALLDNPTLELLEIDTSEVTEENRILSEPVLIDAQIVKHDADSLYVAFFDPNTGAVATHYWAATVQSIRSIKFRLRISKK